MTSERKLKILPTFDKDEFLRKVWTTFANEDAPIELFEKDFETVEVKDYEVLIDTISAEASFSASIGYNRQESYIGYEKYYEEVPYDVREDYYDVTTRSRRSRVVTKFRNIEKERQVTKYKTVTDWSLFSDSRSINKTTAYVTNRNYSDFDKAAFREAYKGIDHSKVISLLGKEAAMFRISSAAYKKAEEEHNRAVQRSVANSLPGDRYRDLDCSYSVIDQTSTLYKVPMYKATINFNGKEYIKYAFPFGDELKICGDKVQNEQSFAAIKSQTERELENNAIKRRSKVESYVWKKTGFIEILATALLILTIIISLLSCILKTSIIHDMAYIGITYGIAVAVFAFSLVLDKIIKNKENSKAESDIQKEKMEADEKLNHFKENHLAELQGALSKKLSTLDYEATGKARFK